MKKDLHLKPTANDYGSGSDSEISEDKQRYQVTETEKEESEEVITLPRRKRTKQFIKQDTLVTSKT